MSDSSVTSARSTEDLVMASLRSYFTCREYHAPLPCYRRDDQGECVLRPMLERWKKYDAPTPFDEHPQVFALSQAGCSRNRAKMILRQEGIGMEDISCVVAAYISQRHQESEVLPKNIGICSQCKPGTNTYAWKKSSFLNIRACHRISINLSESTKLLESDSTKVLCLGRGGKLQFCGPGDFMTVSHVWEHGWQGVAEDGICSRLLDALLTTAASFGLEWVWLDIAMICRDPYARAMSVNRMNLVYTNAKITLVCDRLLLSMQGGSDREKVLALAASDWMTRVWTMQEALLSKNVVIAQRDHCWSTREMITSLVLKDDLNSWQAYGAVRTLFGMVEVVTDNMETILERIILLCRERKTTKEVDLARALFPLFTLTWPGPDTTLIEGQIELLKHLGIHAARCSGLFGPIGLPSPWSWAPISLAGCSGALDGRGRNVAPNGLMGAWAWREVMTTSHASMTGRSGRLSKGEGLSGLLGNVARAFQSGTEARISKLSSVWEIGSSVISDLYRGVITNTSASWEPRSHAVLMAEFTGGICDFVDFTDSAGQECLTAIVYFRKSEPFPWNKSRLFLLSNAGRRKQDEWGYYSLAVVESSDDEWYRMHRVGSVFGLWIEMASEKLSIQGILF